MAKRSVPAGSPLLMRPEEVKGIETGESLTMIRLPSNDGSFTLNKEYRVKGKYDGRKIYSDMFGFIMDDDRGREMEIHYSFFESLNPL